VAERAGLDQRHTAPPRQPDPYQGHGFLIDQLSTQISRCNVTGPVISAANKVSPHEWQSMLPQAGPTWGNWPAGPHSKHARPGQPYTGSLAVADTRRLQVRQSLTISLEYSRFSISVLRYAGQARPGQTLLVAC
jgi:hypothetical protein